MRDDAPGRTTGSTVSEPSARRNDDVQRDASVLGAIFNMTPADLRERWNGALDEIFEGRRGLADPFRLGPTDVEPTTFLGRLTRAGEISGTLDGNGNVRTVRVTIEASGPSPVASAVARAAPSRALIAATLPSRPAGDDAQVRTLAAELTDGVIAGKVRHGLVTAEGIEYAVDATTDMWVYEAREPDAAT